MDVIIEKKYSTWAQLPQVISAILTTPLPSRHDDVDEVVVNFFSDEIAK
jgi:hypothetical protein